MDEPPPVPKPRMVDLIDGDGAIKGNSKSAAVGNKEPFVASSLSSSKKEAVGTESRDQSKIPSFSDPFGSSSSSSTPSSSVPSSSFIPSSSSVLPSSIPSSSISSSSIPSSSIPSSIPSSSNPSSFPPLFPSLLADPPASPEAAGEGKKADGGSTTEEESPISRAKRINEELRNRFSNWDDDEEAVGAGSDEEEKSAPLPVEEIQEIDDPPSVAGPLSAGKGNGCKSVAGPSALEIRRLSETEEGEIMSEDEDGDENPGPKVIPMEPEFTDDEDAMETNDDANDENNMDVDMRTGQAPAGRRFLGFF